MYQQITGYWKWAADARDIMVTDKPGAMVI